MSISGNSGNTGSFTKTLNDRCEIQIRNKESTEPLGYAMAFFKYENKNKAVYDKKFFPTRQAASIIAAENELKNLTKQYSTCPKNKYSPMCQKSCSCLSTYDKFVPVNLPPNLTPIVENNIERFNYPGYQVEKYLSCPKPIRRA